MWNYIEKYIKTKDNFTTAGTSSLNLIFIEWSWLLCFGNTCWSNFLNMDKYFLYKVKFEHFY